MSGQSHLIGPPITWYGDDGAHVRQRCSWCGALLRDDVLSRMMIMIDPDNPDEDTSVPDWPIGEIMRLEGDGWPWIRSIVEVPSSEEDEKVAVSELAPDICFLLDPEVTQ